MDSSALLALGFVNAALLGGTGLVAVPVIIHWLSRRRFRRIEWGAMRFVLEAERENRRRTRFEHWLLLMLRCLAMLLIALMVARPFVRPGLVGELLGRPEPVQRVIVLDDSASLQYTTATTDFERLREAAENLLSWIANEAGGMPLSIRTTSRPAESCFSSDHFGVAAGSEARAALRALEPGVARAEPARLCAALAKLVAADDAARIDVFVLSDLQASDWLRGNNQDSVFAALYGLNARRLRLVLVTPPEESRDNVAISELAIDQPHVVAGIPVTARVRVTNFGHQRADGFSLQFDIDDLPLPARTLEPLEPGEMRTIVQDVTCATPGFATLTARLGQPDRFELDDKRCIAVHVREALRVLVVNGAPASDPRLDEVFLLRHALAPPGPLGSGVRVSELSPEQLDGADLRAYDVVLLCNVGPIASGARDALLRFVQTGGGLALTLGDNTLDAAAFNRVIHADGAELAPLPLSDAVDASAHPVGLVRTGEHALATALGDEAGRMSEYVRFRRYMRTGAASDAVPAPVVLARFDDDESTPALIERRVGDGRVLLFTSSINLAWNNWAAAVDGSYVVTLLELVQHLSRSEGHPASLVGGQPLNVVVSLDEYAPQAVFRSPHYPETPATSGVLEQAEVAGVERAVMRGPIADKLGTYTVELTPRSGAAEERPLCVNLDAAESDMRRATRAELDASLGEIRHTFATLGASTGQAEADSRRELWPILLLLLVVTLMAEQACAWWWGRVTPVRDTGRGRLLARTVGRLGVFKSHEER
ncbi:MAG: BatA domain-containing protein [Phycisphaerae bacterium]|nr:BatA domain-containing protein [Phycisphaerae bacterium]